MDVIVKNPENVNSAEIIVGIPSYNEADSIAFPTDVASRGLIDYFPSKKSVIINVDNCSLDGTMDMFMNTPTKVPKIYISTPKGVKGKGNNLKNLFEDNIKSYNRSGLGLLVVNKLTSRYKGNISIEDRVKGDHTKGSKFIILLPTSK